MVKNLLDFLPVGMLGGVSAYNFAQGGISIMNYLDHVASVREAIYAKAAEITPEVIGQASDVINNIGKGDLYCGFVNITVAGVAWVLANHFSREFCLEKVE